MFSTGSGSGSTSGVWESVLLWDLCLSAFRLLELGLRCVLERGRLVSPISLGLK